MRRVAGLSTIEVLEGRTLLSVAAPILVTAPAGGAQPTVMVYEPGQTTPKLTFLAYGAQFRSGVNVGAGDVDADGVYDIVTGPARGEQSVRAFDGATGQPIAGPLNSFFPYGTRFSGGVAVAAGDVNGDGVAEVITAPASGGRGEVKVFNSQDGHLLASYQPFGSRFARGVAVTSTDFDADGKEDILVGAAGGSARYMVISGANGSVLLEGVADFGIRRQPGIGSVSMQAGHMADVNGSQKLANRIYVGSRSGTQNYYERDDTGLHVYTSPSSAYDTKFRGGVHVASAIRPAAQTLTTDFITAVYAPASGAKPVVVDSIQIGQPSVEVTFFPYGERFRGGINLALRG